MNELRNAEHEIVSCIGRLTIAIGEASPLADIILQQLLRDAVQLGNRITQLRLAVEAEATK
jgi:hypothetical protein